MTFVIDPLVLAFVLVATVAAALLFGMLPAWQLTRTDGDASLREQSRGMVGVSGQMRSGRFLVSLQLALCLPLLVGAGLLARTVYNLQRIDLGFAAERLLLVRVDLRDAGEQTQRDLVLRQVVGEIERLPGVREVSFSQLGIFSGGESSTTIEVEGYVPKGDRDRGSATDVVGPGYFSTLGIPLRLGREIVESDDADSALVCVINEAFAHRFFDRRDPIGMRVASVGGDGTRTGYRVVGVAANPRAYNLRGDIEPRYFVAARQEPGFAQSPTLLISTATASAALLPAVRRTIAGAIAAVPVSSAKTIEEQIAPLTAQDRSTAELAVVFGSVALILAGIGLYGVLSYAITRRRGEIAIRIALGAQRGRVITMILRETIGVVAAGLALGGALAYLAARLVGSRLYGVAPQDPLTVTAATGLLLLVALSAAYWPAQRASRLDPLVALRQQ